MFDSASQGMLTRPEIEHVRIQSVDRISECSAFNDFPGRNSNSGQWEVNHRSKLASWEDLGD